MSSHKDNPDNTGFEKVPLGLPEDALPDISNKKPKKRRNKRSAEEIRQSKKRFKKAIRECTIVAILLLFLFVAYDIYREQTTDEFLKDDRFAITAKEIIPAESVKHPFLKTDLGAEKYITLPPLYMLTVLGEKTENIYYLLVSDKYFRSCFANTVVNTTDISGFEKFTRIDQIHLRYREQKISEIVNEVEEQDGTDFEAIGKVVENVKDKLQDYIKPSATN